MPPNPAIVWLVRAGERDGTRGLLAIEHDELLFRPDEGETLRIGPRRILGAKREVATPVLTVTYLADPGEVTRLLLYFAPPPPMKDKPRSLWDLMRPRGLERTAGVMSLRRRNRQLNPVIADWVDEIERIRATARGR